MMVKNLRLAVLLAAAAVTAVACGGGEPTATPEETTGGQTTGTAAATGTATATATDGAATGDLGLVTDGTLTVCTDAPYFPMEFEDPDSPSGYSGFDIELMGAVAEQLGLELAVVNSGFDPITSGIALSSGQCDIAAASITITEERDQNVDFTEPYFEADQSLLVETDSGISSLEDLAGQSIGVQTGTTGEMYARENAPEDATLVAYETGGDIFLALEAGEVQGVLQDLVVNQGRVLEAGDDSVAVVETYETDEMYGFAVEEGDTVLLDAVNQALATLMDDGTYDALYEEWFGTE